MRQAFGCVVLFCVTSLATAENWPGWRGPRSDGTSTEKNVPLSWSPKENVRWKLKLPGPGNSSPIVWGDRVFLTQSLDAGGTQRAVFCIDRADGKILWKQAIPFKGKEPTHGTNPYCPGTPVTDGEVVIAAQGSAGVVCYDFAGKQLWHTDLGPIIHIWGPGTSPVLYGDLVLLNWGPGANTFLIALDKKTGKEVWKVAEPGGSSGQGDSKAWVGSWSTPRIVNVAGKDQVIVSWPKAVKAYDPESGDLLWTCSGLTELVYTSPVTNGEILVAMSGYGGTAIGLKLGGKGDITATNRLWVQPKGNPQRIGSGIIVGEHLYMANAAGPGTVQCIDLKTGKDVWNGKEKLGANHWGSMVLVDGKLLATDQNGTTHIIEAKPEFKLLGKNSIGEHVNSSLAISDGDIFIRSFESLWCIGKGKP